MTGLGEIECFWGLDKNLGIRRFRLSRQGYPW
jgi:hypothetical protein